MFLGLAGNLRRKTGRAAKGDYERRHHVGMRLLLHLAEPFPVEYDHASRKQSGNKLSYSSIPREVGCGLYKDVPLRLELDHLLAQPVNL